MSKIRKPLRVRNRLITFVALCTSRDEISERVYIRDGLPFFIAWDSKFGIRSYYRLAAWSKDGSKEIWYEASRVDPNSIPDYFEDYIWLEGINYDVDIQRFVLVSPQELKELVDHHENQYDLYRDTYRREEK